MQHPRIIFAPIFTDFANNEEHLREEYQELNDGDNQAIFNVDSRIPITNESVNPEVIGTPMEL